MRWSEILQLARSNLNDQIGAVYDDEFLLPYLNIARSELQQIYQLNNIAVTNETSAVINVPEGTTEVGFNTDLPARLPADLISIRQLWWSPENQNQFIPSTRKTYLTGQAIGPNILVSGFEVWAWMDQKIKLLEANVNLDIKLDYIQNLFSLLTKANLNDFNPTLSTEPFYFWRVAAICYDFVEEDDASALRCDGFAGNALQAALGIDIKSSQTIFVRRRPFRAGWKSRKVLT